MQRFNQCSILLQSSSIELATAVSLTKSLDQFVTECREKFGSYNVKAYDRSGNKSYKFEIESRRAPKRMKHFSEGSVFDALQGMSGVNKFKVSTFYVIIDQLKNALKQRINHIHLCNSVLAFQSNLVQCPMKILKLQLKDLLMYIQKISLSSSYSEFCQFIFWYKEQSKNTAKKSQQALLNIFLNCCTQMESHCIPKYRSNFLEYIYHLCLLIALKSVRFHSLLELRL